MSLVRVVVLGMGETGKGERGKGKTLAPVFQAGDCGPVELATAPFSLFPFPFP